MGDEFLTAGPHSPVAASTYQRLVDWLTVEMALETKMCTEGEMGC